MNLEDLLVLTFVMPQSVELKWLIVSELSVRKHQHDGGRSYAHVLLTQHSDDGGHSNAHVLLTQHSDDGGRSNAHVLLTQHSDDGGRSNAHVLLTFASTSSLRWTINIITYILI